MEANCRAWIGTLNLIWLNHQKLGSDQTELWRGQLHTKRANKLGFLRQRMKRSFWFLFIYSHSPHSGWCNAFHQCEHTCTCCRLQEQNNPP